ncbi:hypothetical protein M422DRAFT_221634 [Sphaerobolus stellatus SS14]|nr:hypothetical protein M422DRAFT_221634 [Sphaerobolus stellatus SS14]
MSDTETRPISSLTEILSQKADDSKLLSSTQASSYLSYLATLPLHSLQAEPQTLTEEANTLTFQLTNLCTSEYSTFLALHSTASTLSDSLSSFSSSLDSLLETIPQLESETRNFAASTKVIQAERRTAALVLEQHEKLLDILQIPQLIDTCVRNGYYSEAMDLSAHASSLLARFPTIPVIVDVAAEAEQAIRLMSTQLLALLREPAKLPALFKAVNFLRRMGTLDEEELALAFLSGREVHVLGLFAAIEQQRTDHARYLKKYADIFREGVYDVVSQYTSIFLDRIAGDSNRSELYSTLLHFLQTYIHTHIVRLMDLLTETIPKVDDLTSLTSLLTQLTYCAASFARVGLDFRSLLEKPFTDAVLSSTKTALTSASQQFSYQMEKHTDRPLSAWFITRSMLDSLPQDIPKLAESTPVHIAPSILSSFPPLAVYTNSILTAFNSLRQLCPLSIYSNILAEMETSLADVGKALFDRINSERKENQEGTEVEEEVLLAAGVVYVGNLVPFALRGLRKGVYGFEDESKILGDLKDVIEKVEGWVEFKAKRNGIQVDET